MNDIDYKDLHKVYNRIYISEPTPTLPPVVTQVTTYEQVYSEPYEKITHAHTEFDDPLRDLLITVGSMAVGWKFMDFLSEKR